MSDAAELPSVADATPEIRLGIDVVLAPKISFAAHQSAVAVLRELRLLNTGSLTATDLVLEIKADPPVIAHRQWRVDRVAPGGEAVVKDRDVQLNAGLLLGLAEAMRGTVTVRARAGNAEGAVLAERCLGVELLARTEWGGGAAMPELLAAFVMPNDPAVSRLLKSASDVLRRAGRPDGLDGYTGGSRERVWELASAMWSAVTALRLSYALPPPSFELQGQKVRPPGTVVEAGLATCLDTALLFASMLEGAGLYPVMILTQGHAFTGVWLQPQEFATLQVADAATLRKRIALKELVVFETTTVTGATPALFADAIALGEREIDEAHEAAFVLALDIRRARMQRIKPLALSNEAPAPTGEGADTPPAPDVLQTAPALPGFDLVEPDTAPQTPEERLRRWQRKLLDLTTRNRLLNVKPGANALRLLCPDPAALEDDLTAGKRFRIVAAPSLAGAAGRDDALHTQRTGEMLDGAYGKEAFARGEILSPGTQDKLDAQLVELYRKAKLDLAEGGANTMFLAIGMLAWRRPGADARLYRAPLILLPVKLERHSARSGVQMSHHEDEPRFNPTLLQMLRQDFELTIPELGGALPTDASGIDVPRVLTIMRKAVVNVRGCEVTDDLMLGAFSFAKYLMWEDLQRRADVLKRNPVVRHLLDTPREPYAATALPPEPEALDAEVTPAELFMPLPADSSQVAAVVGSGRGADFVLDGPPGTGKSQTIANMIAHNLALGRTVLFVAEKRAALDVVHRRLQANGLGPFCLQLHSNKAAKQEVLAQLDSAWSASGAFVDGEWATLAAELKTTRDGLNRLAAAVNQVHPNGLSLFAAIGLVAHDGADAAIRLGWLAGVEHNAAEMAAMRDACRRLDLNRLAGLAGRGNALGLVGRTEWSNAWRGELLASCAALGAAGSVLTDARTPFEAALGLVVPRDRRGLHAITALATAIGGAHGQDLGCVFLPNATRAMEHAEASLPLIESYRLELVGLGARMDAAAIRAVPVDALQTQWNAASSLVWPLSRMRKAALSKLLHAGGDLDPEAALPRLRRLQASLAQIDALAPDAAGVAGWAGAETDVDQVRQALAAGRALRQAITAAADTPERLLALREAARRLCCDGNDLLAPTATVGRAAAALVAAERQFHAALDAFERSAAVGRPLDADDLCAYAGDVAAALPGQSRHLRDWCGWRRACDAAAALGLSPLVAALDGDHLGQRSVAEAFEHGYAFWWAGTAIDANPVLRGFNRAEHADSIARFRMLDDRLMALSQLVIRGRLSGALPAKDARTPPPGFNALAHELELKRSRKPLRQLIQDMGPALHRLAPCLLMSPLSIAQYLPADGEVFDLVIFDEASQIAPWDAVGAIARGRQVVIAGDPKQMPPTSFFERGTTDSDGDDGATLEDQESILDECLGARLPRRRLTWHYRSRNESLIHFSNVHYYDGSPQTFPAPVTRDTAVSLRRVAGVWARGKERVNRIEAAAVVAEVSRRLLDKGFKDEAGRALSLAVITFNAEQQKLIEDLLDAERRSHPELEPSSPTVTPNR